MVTIEV